MTDILLRFVHISDTHISHDPAYGTDRSGYTPEKGAEALVERINSLPFVPDFVLHTGDVAYDPFPEAYGRAREILERIIYPVHYLAGNHDDSQMLQRLFLQRDDIQPKLNGEFEMNGVRVILLDSTGPVEQPRGIVSDEQLTWLGEICREDSTQPLVITVHHNPLPVGVPWLDEFMPMENGEALHQPLLPARHRIRGVFYGHIHQNSQTLRDGILYSSVLSSWYQLQSWPGQTDTLMETDAEPGFNIVTITADQTHIRCHRYPRPVL